MRLHTAILVTTGHWAVIHELQVLAGRLGVAVLTDSNQPGDYYYHALICPHGQSQGHREQREGDLRRKELVAWLKRQDLPVDWAEVTYGAESLFPPTVRATNYNQQRKK